MPDKDAPAWMLCDDMITRMKDELVLEAIDLLHEEIKAGRIDVKGYTAVLPDRPAELQRDMYLIGNLVEREHEILQQYAPYAGNMAETDPKKLGRIEELGKFVLAVKAISMLMRLSAVAERWALDTGRYSALDDSAEILAKTAMMADERRELVEFVLSSRRFMKSEALTGSEIEKLRAARKALG